ncbi:MAG: hypothetical protein HRT71_21475 [Flavobacteriales bacterium]|nr:hypothetical protein [Flavobacteriales bacterium]
MMNENEEINEDLREKYFGNTVPPAIKTGMYIGAGMLALYLSKYLFKLTGESIKSFKEMRNAIKS